MIAWSWESTRRRWGSRSWFLPRDSGRRSAWLTTRPVAFSYGFQFKRQRDGCRALNSASTLIRESGLSAATSYSVRVVLLLKFTCTVSRGRASAMLELRC